MEFFQFICSNSILVKIKETLNSSFSPFTTEQFSCIMYNFFSFSVCFSFFLSLLIYLFIFFLVNKIFAYRNLALKGNVRISPENFICDW